MSNNLRMCKDTILLWIPVIIFSVIAFVYSMNYMSLYQCTNIEELIIIIYSGLNIDLLITNIIPIFAWMIPTAYLMYIKGNAIYDVMKLIAPFTFTRTDTREKWFINQVLRLFLFIMAYDAVQYLILMLLSLLKGYNVTENTLTIICLQFILSVLFHFFIILSMNVLSFFVKDVLSYFIIIMITLGSLLISSVIYNFRNIDQIALIKIIKFIPTSHAFLTWHKLGFWESSLSYLYLEQFYITYTIGYWIIAIAFVMIIGVRYIKNTDFI